jgi:hypothetical protein
VAPRAGAQLDGGDRDTGARRVKVSQLAGAVRHNEFAAEGGRRERSGVEHSAGVGRRHGLVGAEPGTHTRRLPRGPIPARSRPASARMGPPHAAALLSGWVLTPCETRLTSCVGEGLSDRCPEQSKERGTIVCAKRKQQSVGCASSRPASPQGARLPPPGRGRERGTLRALADVTDRHGPFTRSRSQRRVNASLDMWTTHGPLLHRLHGLRRERKRSASGMSTVPTRHYWCSIAAAGFRLRARCAAAQGASRSRPVLRATRSAFD